SKAYEHGDSLNRPVAADIPPILRWAFAGLEGFAPSLQQQSFDAGVIDLQGYSGGGSCGIAATNFIERKSGIPCLPWRAEQSSFFRGGMIQDMLLYHLISRRKTTVCCSA
ncbi:hypothetical protein R3P38DRAFT_2556810, partial [Favolaschia claudopus]